MSNQEEIRFFDQHITNATSRPAYIEVCVRPLSAQKFDLLPLRRPASIRCKRVPGKVRSGLPTG